MKQVLQNLNSGKTELHQIPCPAFGHHDVLVRTKKSLVSPGTERMLVEFSRAGFVGKAMQQPERVAQVWSKMKTDGIAPTLDAVFHKLNQPLPLGYCNVGRVLDCGHLVTGLGVGDRVASNGHHAEVVAVGKNLCVKIPDGVSDEQASFTVLGAIGLQGVRLAQPSLGETVAVIGLGLIGLMSVQMLLANGCRVIGLDFNSKRLELARSFGAETVQLDGDVDVVAQVKSKLALGLDGVDAVLITAATSSNAPVQQAAQMSRKRGRIVLVGVVGLELSRADFFEKELTFQVSCSYGPGRYDEAYEQGGFDYPIGFVRWTEKRNFEAVLDMMARGALNVEPLITNRFEIEQIEDAFGVLSDTRAKDALGIILNYKSEHDYDNAQLLQNAVPIQSETPLRATTGQKTSIALVGAGNHSARSLGPAFKRSGADLNTIVSRSGVSGTMVAKQLGFAKSSTSFEDVLLDETVNSVLVATRHDLHAQQVCAALAAGKHVFVEKPLALNLTEIERIEAAAYATSGQHLFVGFNRRFAPHVSTAKALLAGRHAPVFLSIKINAGAIPKDHWTQNLSIGGGRIIGEACHFLDLAYFLVGHSIEEAQIMPMAAATKDSAIISMRFVDGSVASVEYFANGPKSLPKERIELSCAGRALQIDNFRRMHGVNWKGFRRQALWRQDKGHDACAKAFVDAVQNGTDTPIPLDEILEISRLSVKLAEQIA